MELSVLKEELLTSRDNDKVTKEKLFSEIDEWSRLVYGLTFQYRPGQKEAICDILYAWLNGTDDVILDAPTGTGKSIIALSVAGVLNKYYNKEGYILISDLSLMEQYERDLDKYFPTWGLLKGQQTYTCNKNGMPFPSGVCQVNGCKTYADIAKSFPDCSDTCEYIFERNKAISAPVTICTYSLWLLQMNYVAKVMPNAPFTERDFVICDEAHKLQGIVQSHFSPKFGKEDFTKILAVKNTFDNTTLTDWPEYIQARTAIVNETDNAKIVELMKDYLAIMEPLYKEVDKVRDIVLKLAGDACKLSKDDHAILKACNFYENHYRTFEEYIYIIEGIGPHALVKNDSANDGSITFNCLDESYLMGKYFHSNCNRKMYMSATIGDPEVFAHDVAIPDKKFYLKMPSVFDYTNSPIFFVKEYELSYRKKEESLPYIIKMINGIMHMYKDYRGIIQTGSYAFAKALQNGLDRESAKRLILYEDSNSKNDGLELYKCDKNRVLVGPSLIEGLSFDDDLCRFQIIMKVPYPSLADKFVSAKMNYDKQWYSNTTAISILQGVGRGVRNMHDWCVTFILDGCFLRLYYMSQSMFPPEFSSRIQVIDGNLLMNQ